MKEALELKRRQMIRDFLNRWFLLGGFISSDTYKRTMWRVDEKLSQYAAVYHLTLRKGLPETGANNRLIMAGHEWMLRQWFMQPLKRRDVELAIEYYANHSAVKAFPTETFMKLLSKQPDKYIYLPIDVWGFPGGQTFFSGIPCLSFEGMGGLISFIEPQMCRYFGPVIHATKGRLMFEVAGADHAEFAYRSDSNELMSLAKLFAIYVGNGDNKVLTSCDGAEFMFPDLFKSIGTIGHEYMCAFQTFFKGLDEAEREAMNVFAKKSETASLLCDLVDAETVGLENAIYVMKKHKKNGKIGIRVDSGNIAEQCVQYYLRMKQEGITGRTIVFEDEVSPDKIREVKAYFLEKTGVEPTMLFPGVGGYYYRGFHRDTLSAAFKRSMTKDYPNTKFSNSPGKESMPGKIRVYDAGDQLIVADATEKINGEPLFVKLVDQGRIVNPEDMNFRVQAQRANKTWSKYRGYTISPLITMWLEKFQTMRKEAQENALAK